MKKLILILGLGALVVFSGCTKSKESQLSQRVKFKNVLILGWEGVDKNVLVSLLAERKLPHFERLIKGGTFVDISSVEAEEDKAQLSGITDSRPSWVSILTGYKTKELGTVSDTVYSSIVKGLSIFERVSDKSKKEDLGVKLILASGDRNTFGVRRRHRVCINCKMWDKQKKTKTTWASSPERAPLKDGESKRVLRGRKAEIMYTSRKSFDLLKLGLGENFEVARTGFAAISNLGKKNPFLAMLHFQDPERSGHLYGVSSKQYRQSIRELDLILGKVTFLLHKMQKLDETLIFVVSDHGFDQEFTHENSPNTILASNIKNLNLSGDRLDFAPTVLDLMRIPHGLGGFELYGKTLLNEQSTYSGSAAPPNFMQEHVSGLEQIKVVTSGGALPSGLVRASLTGRFVDSELNVNILSPKKESKFGLDGFAGAVHFSMEPNSRDLGAVESLVSGESDLAVVSGAQFLKARVSQKELVAVAELSADQVQTPSLGMIFRKGLSDSDIVKGKKFVFSSPNPPDLQDSFLLEYLKSKKLKKEDVKIEYDVSDEIFLKGILDGSIDAGLYDIGVVQSLVASGADLELRHLNWVDPQLRFALLVTTKEILKKKRSALSKMLQALEQQGAIDKELPIEVYKNLSKIGGVQLGFDIESDMRGMSLPILAKNLRVKPQRLQKLKRILSNHKVISSKISVKETFDNSLFR